MSRVIGILALLWTGMLCAGTVNAQDNNGIGGFAGQAGIYSTLYNGGSEYQQAENCLQEIVIPYTAFTTASTSQQVTIATMPSLWSPRVIQVEETAGQLTVRVCGVTLQ